MTENTDPSYADVGSRAHAGDTMLPVEGHPEGVGRYEDEARADLRAFIGPNSDGYLTMAAGAYGWKGCLGGALAPPAFFLYRRMYATGAATVVVPWLAARLLHVRALPTLAVGYAGYAIYLRAARWKAGAIRRSSRHEGEARRRMRLAGGTDVPAAWLGIVALLALGVWLLVLRGHPVAPLVPGSTPVAPQPGWPFKALLLALLPGAVIAILLLRSGAGRVSAATLATAASLGAAISVVPGALSILEAIVRTRLSPMQDAFATAFVFAGLFEEGAKLWVAATVVPRLVGRRNDTAIVVATAGVALGFALLENVNTVIGQVHWERIAIARSLLAVPIHTLLGFYLGRGLAVASREKGTKRWTRLAATLIWAAILHGSYDFPLLCARQAPLVPTPVAQVAAAFSLRPAVFLAAMLAAAIAAICAAAVRGAPVAATGARVPRPQAPSRRRLSSAACGALALALGACATAAIALGSEAFAAGVYAPLALSALDVAFILATCACIVSLATPSPREATGIRA